MEYIFKIQEFCGVAKQYPSHHKQFSEVVKIPIDTPIEIPIKP